MADNWQEELARLRTRLEGLAAGQIQAWAQEREAIYQQEQRRFAEVNHNLPMTVRDAVEDSHNKFQHAIEALADTRWLRDAQHDPDYQAMMRERQEHQTTQKQGVRY